MSFQPPPQIYDAQLEEREHAIEEWKGKTGPFLGRPIVHKNMLP
jgi:hypothetical protein